jgi:hypothetical protein
MRTLYPFFLLGQSRPRRAGGRQGPYPRPKTKVTKMTHKKKRSMITSICTAAFTGLSALIAFLIYLHTRTVKPEVQTEIDNTDPSNPLFYIYVYNYNIDNVIIFKFINKSKLRGIEFFSFNNFILFEEAQEHTFNEEILTKNNNRLKFIFRYTKEFDDIQVKLETKSPKVFNLVLKNKLRIGLKNKLNM